jgi:hypothetical protein
MIEKKSSVEPPTEHIAFRLTASNELAEAVGNDDDNDNVDTYYTPAAPPADDSEAGADGISAVCPRLCGPGVGHKPEHLYTFGPSIWHGQVSGIVCMGRGRRLMARAVLILGQRRAFKTMRGPWPGTICIEACC